MHNLLHDFQGISNLQLSIHTVFSEGKIRNAMVSMKIENGILYVYMLSLKFICIRKGHKKKYDTYGATVSAEYGQGGGCMTQYYIKHVQYIKEKCDESVLNILVGDEHCCGILLRLNVYVPVYCEFVHRPGDEDFIDLYSFMMFLVSTSCE